MLQLSLPLLAKETLFDLELDLQEIEFSSPASFRVFSRQILLSLISREPRFILVLDKYGGALYEPRRFNFRPQLVLKTSATCPLVSAKTRSNNSSLQNDTWALGTRLWFPLRILRIQAALCISPHALPQNGSTVPTTLIIFCSVHPPAESEAKGL